MAGSNGPLPINVRSLHSRACDYLRLPCSQRTLACSPSNAPDATPTPDEGVEPIKDLITEALSTGIPAVAGGAIVEGELVALGAGGVYFQGSSSPVQTTNKFRLGSCTKAMTGTLAAILVEEEVVSWTQTAADAFPDLSIHTGFADVTLVDLLSHHAGTSLSLPGEHPALWNSLLFDARPLPKQRMEVAKEVLESPPRTHRNCTHTPTPAM